MLRGGAADLVAVMAGEAARWRAVVGADTVVDEVVRCGAAAIRMKPGGGVSAQIGVDRGDGRAGGQRESRPAGGSQCGRAGATGGCALSYSEYTPPAHSITLESHVPLPPTVRMGFGPGMWMKSCVRSVAATASSDGLEPPAACCGATGAALAAPSSDSSTCTAERMLRA